MTRLTIIPSICPDVNTFFIKVSESCPRCPDAKRAQASAHPHSSVEPCTNSWCPTRQKKRARRDLHLRQQPAPERHSYRGTFSRLFTGAGLWHLSADRSSLRVLYPACISGPRGATNEDHGAFVPTERRGAMPLLRQAGPAGSRRVQSAATWRAHRARGCPSRGVRPGP